MFRKENLDRLSELHPYDCPIDILDGVCPPFGPIYGLSELELEALYVGDGRQIKTTRNEYRSIN